MASPSEIQDEILTLAAMCRPPVMTADERARWLAAWLEELRDYPPAAIRSACRVWRQSTAARFPTVGQLVPLVQSASRPEGDATKAEEWRPLSDGEYEALPLSEKVRHHEILAHEASPKAGPMWRGGIAGRALRPEEMPEAWSGLTALAARHREEAARLRGKLREAIARRATAGHHALRASGPLGRFIRNPAESSREEEDQAA